MQDTYYISLSKEEISLLIQWLGMMVDRGDLVEELEEDGTYHIAYHLYKSLNKTYGEMK